MYEIKLSTADEMLASANQLFAEHWDEIALNKSVMALKPDADRYRAIEANGGLFILAAFHDGKLVGYSINFIANHLHYADLRISSNDLLFVAKDHRNGRLGLRLIQETETHAKSLGASMVLWHAKTSTALEKLMPRLGYGVQDIIFSKEV